MSHHRKLYAADLDPEHVLPGKTTLSFGKVVEHTMLCMNAPSCYTNPVIGERTTTRLVGKHSTRGHKSSSNPSTFQDSNKNQNTHSQLIQVYVAALVRNTLPTISTSKKHLGCAPAEPPSNHIWIQKRSGTCGRLLQNEKYELTQGDNSASPE